MTLDRDQRLSELFEAALDLPAADRAAFLEKACAGDRDLLAELHDLLKHHDAVDDFLEPPRVVARTGSSLAEVPPGDLEEIPDVLGPYVLKEVIAEGGMGTVYRAEQTSPVQRPVAVKLVKFGMDTKRLLARFHAERQTLALMDHPHVTRVFDAGSTPSGRPYFVMEYFPGRSLTRFADEEEMSVRDRLKLFLQACEAVHSAHQKGVIHRDLKPSNLLVRRVEGRPFLKVIDFGIAKVLEDADDDATQLTRHGEVIGTPDYMSPEQIGHVPGGCDTTSDVYSLGVVLYELLTGTLPHEPSTGGSGSGSGPRRDTATPRPSDRVVAAPDPSRASRERKTDPEGLRRQLRRDLDWIVLKAMDPEKARRYQSVHELGADIERFLDGDTVLAAAPTTAYRVQKFFQRYRALVIGAAAVLLTLVGGIVSTSWFALQADHERARQVAATVRANEQAHRAELNAYAASMIAANGAFEDGDMSAVEKQLSRAPESLRGWEWFYLHGQIDDSALRWTLPPGYRMIYQGSVVIPPGDRTVVALAEKDQGGAWFEWNIDTGELIRKREFPEDRRGLCMSSDGVWLGRVAGGRCIVERAATGEERSIRLGDLDPSLVPMLFLDGGNALLFADSLDVWKRSVIVDLESGAIVPFGWAGLTYPGTGNAELAVCLENDVEIRDRISGRTLRRIRVPHLTNVAWHPDGRGLYAIDSDGALHNEVFTGRPSSWASVSVDAAALRGLAVGSSGEILTGGAGRTLEILDPATGARRATLHGHREFIGEIAACRRRPLAVSHSETEILVWNLDRAARAEGQVLAGHTSYVYPVEFSEDGGTVASGGWDGRIILNDVDSGRIIRSWSFPDAEHSSIQDLRFDAGRNEIVATVNRARTSRILVRVDVATGAVDSLALPPVRIYNRIDIDPVRHRAAAVWFRYSGPSGLIVWDLDRMETMYEETDDTNHPVAQAFCLSYSPDGTRLAVTLGDHRLRILDASTFAPIDTLDLEPRDYSVISWSPDGSRIAAARRDGTIVIRDADSLAVLAQMTGHTGFVYGLCWSPDGSRIISGGEDRLVRIWSAETWEELLRLRGHESYVYGVDMSPDGTRIASGSGDGTVRIWSAEPDRPTTGPAAPGNGVSG